MAADIVSFTLRLSKSSVVPNIPGNILGLVRIPCLQELLQMPPPAHRHHRPGQAGFFVAQAPQLSSYQASQISIPKDTGSAPTQECLH